MKKGKCFPIDRMSNSLIAVALSALLPLAVQADNASGLRLETASLDVSQASNVETPTPATKTTVLYGEAHKHDASLEATDSSNFSSEKAATDEKTPYALAAQKLASGQELSSYDYRSLGAGCAGYESNRTLFQDIAKVSIVYRDSPAYKAGLRKGDKLIDKEDDSEAKANPTVPLWGISCGLAGTPVTLTVLRHGHPVALTMIRENIEDIQEPEIRQEWEAVIRKLGYPKDGEYIGRDMNTLHRIPDSNAGGS